MTPRSFLPLILTSLLFAPLAARTVFAQEGELLYNGIQLPREWPPKVKADGIKPRPIPYLQTPPAVIPIDVGRQLFVDDFLIDKTDATRTFHRAERYAKNPILKPETEVEKKGPVATLFNDGVWFDPKDKTFKMWYHAGWFDGTGYATSKDGLTWTRPTLDVVPGTNLILPKAGHGARDGSSIWLDQWTTDPAERFKMFIYERPKEQFGGRIFTSADGIHWDDKARPNVADGDNTTIFYNPFRKKWVYSLRVYRHGRARNYVENDDLVKGAAFQPADEIEWENIDTSDVQSPANAAIMPKDDVTKALYAAAASAKPYADALRQASGAQDTPYVKGVYDALVKAGAKVKSAEDAVKFVHDEFGDPPQLYNVDAVGYESIMLGVFGVLGGPQNKVATAMGIPKDTDLQFGYSRDGFNFSRPDRTPFLAATAKAGDWDRGYLHTTSGICLVMGDKLYFYYGAWSGQHGNKEALYADGAVGIATMRRDGFVSMDAADKPATLLTRPLTFKGKYLFVNAVDPKGQLTVEVDDESGRPINGFAAANCVPFTGDSTKQAVTFKGSPDLSSLSGKKVRLRFTLRNASLYSFWVTSDPKGASHGFVAGGGPEFSGPVDNGVK